MRVPIATVHETRTLRFLPSLAVIGLAWLALFPITSVDAYYHLATGRRILDYGEIPRVGVGSATFGNRPWHDNEWGFQVAAAALATPVLDDSGVWVLTPASRVRLILFRALCLALTLAALSGQMAAAGVDAVTRAVALVLAAFLTFGNLFWAIRPQILSYLFLAVTAYLLERDRLGRRGSSIAALGLVALWANVHGAFVIGIALIASEAAGEWIDLVRRGGVEGSVARARRLTVVTLLAPAAACLNPHGALQLLHPFLYLGHPEIYRGNAEWSRPDFLHLPLLLAMAALLVVALAARRHGRSADLVRIASFGVLGLTAIRHLPMVAIVWVPVLAASLNAVAALPGRLRSLLPTGPGRATGARLLSAVAASAVIVALSGAKFVGPLPRFDERPVLPMPEAAVRIISREPPIGSVFNAYRFGGFLMFRLYPRDVVFMDGRNDLYGPFRDEVYNPILTAAPGWRDRWSDAIREHDVRWVLVDERDGLATELRSDPSWRPAGGSGPSGVTDGEPGSAVVLLSRVDSGRSAPASGGGILP